MKRAARGLDVPQGTASQESAAMKCFEEFLALAGMDESSLNGINKALSGEGPAPSQNFYSLLTTFSIYLQTKKSSRASLLAKATAEGYMSQVVNFLMEKYPVHLSDSKRIGKVREKMANAIDDRNLVANVQTGEAPRCTIQDLQLLVQELVIDGVGSGVKSFHDATILTLMWHTFGRAIGTCFARKRQLTIATSGELFLQVARIKTSVVQGVSIFKAAKRWKQCMLHALGVLFAGASEPSSYVFPLVSRSATSDLPGGQTYSQDEAMVYWESLDASDDDATEKSAKRVRTRPNVAKYINDMLGEVVKHAAESRQVKSMTPGMTSHSLHRGSAAYVNGSPKLAIQWISPRGAWLLDSLTKVFAYVGTTTREDQSVGKVLAGYKDPDLPVATPSVRGLEPQLPALEYVQLMTLREQLFRNVTGFADDSLNISGDVLDAALASMLIHLEEAKEAVDNEKQRSGYTSHYIYRFYEALEPRTLHLGAVSPRQRAPDGAGAFALPGSGTTSRKLAPAAVAL